MRKSKLVLAAFAFFVTLALTPLCTAQEQLVGEWKASLSAGGQTFRLLWHVVKAPDGTVTSTYDNVDEGVSGIKVQSMTVKDSAITVTINDVIHPNGQDVPLSGTFVGTISKDGNEVSGVWTQTEPPNPPADLNFKREPPTAAAPTQ